ncbi:MAG: DUF1028 domain-containing protein [Pseudomonadota bacterium]
MTWSIIGRDEETGAIGILVASRAFACGSGVPYIGRRSAVATQAFINMQWGVEGRRRLENGEDGQAVLADFIRRDGGQQIRQCHMLDTTGQFVAHTGEHCIGWAGHRCGTMHSVAGNMLEGSDVVDATFESFANNSQAPLAERLIAAMEAGEAAGGDKRGRQGAGLVIHKGQEWPWLDMRCDDGADPLSELRRLLDVAKERWLLMADILPTRENFTGRTERQSFDNAVLKAEAARTAAGIKSRSYATSKK